MRDEVETVFLDEGRDFHGNRNPAAARQIGLDHIRAVLFDKATEVPDRLDLFSRGDRHRTDRAHRFVLIEPFGMDEVFDPADVIVRKPLA